MDLDALARPCPKGGARFRPEAERRGGKQFPFLADPNTGMQLHDSAAIVEYLDLPNRATEESRHGITAAIASMFAGLHAAKLDATRRTSRR